MANKLITCYAILITSVIVFLAFCALTHTKNFKNTSPVDSQYYSGERTSHPNGNAKFQNKLLSTLGVSPQATAKIPINATVHVVQEVSAHMLVTLSRATFHHHSYNVRISPSECGAAPLMALVMVQCLPQSPIRRQVVRETWGKGAVDIGYKIVFFMGITSDTNFDAIARESLQHKDILMLDFQEDYLNLTMKSIQMVKWTANNCSSARYLVKVDDDVCIYVDQLHDLLKSRTSYKRQILGVQAENYKPMRDTSSKWYMPYEVYSDTFYPTFTYGPCYVLSFDILSEIHRISQTLAYIPYEDVFITGICASWISDVTRYHSATFIQTKCSVPNTVAVHWFSCTGDKQVELIDLFSGKLPLSSL